MTETSLLGFLANWELVRPLLAAKSTEPCKLDVLRAKLAEAEKQAAKIVELILGDDQPSKILYERLKIEEVQAGQLRSEIDGEMIRIKAEVPALEACEHFITVLADRSIDKARRPLLRRAFAALLEKSFWTHTGRMVFGATPCI